MLFIVTVFFGTVALIHLPLFAWCVLEQRKAKKRGEPPWPGLRFGTDATGTIGILSAIAALLFVARLAGSADGGWKTGLLLLVNVVIQPLCLLCLVNGFMTIWHTLRGRFVYAVQVVPEDRIPPEMRQKFRRDRIAGSLVVIAFGCGLSWSVISPWF